MVNLVLNIIMFISMYPILFIMYFYQNSEIERDEKKGILFGIHYSAQWLSDRERSQIMEAYHKQMKRALVILAPSPLVMFLVPYFSVCFALWFVWIFVLIGILVFDPCVRGFNRVRELKAGRMMSDENLETSFYELKEAGNIRTIRIVNMIPLVVLNIAMPVFALIYFHGARIFSYSGILIVFALSNLLLMVCALWMDRMKTRVISQDSDVNVNYARANKKLWKRFWLMSCWLMTAYTLLLLVYFMLSDASGKVGFSLMIGGCILVCLVMLAMVIRLLAKKEKIEQLYESKQDFNKAQDEKGWIGGIIYYNPNDRHTLVPKKIGTGAAFNLAAPVGKGFTVFGMLCLLLVPILCVRLMVDEFTPLNLYVQEETLVAVHTDTEYSVPLEDIVTVTLLEELPKSRKVHGTNMDRLETGTFRNSVDGRVEECLNPKQNLFLRVETEDTVYYFSSYSEEATREVYELLTGY